MIRYPMKAYFLLIVVLSSQLSFAEGSGWMPGFISEVFQDQLEKAGSYRAHYNNNAYIDLKFEEGQAYITVSFLKDDGTEHITIGDEIFPKLRLIEDGFRVRYELKDNRIYFDQPLERIGGGGMGTVDENFFSIKIKRASAAINAIELLSNFLEGEAVEVLLNDFIFYRLAEKTDGECLSWGPFDRADLALKYCERRLWKDLQPAIYDRSDRVWRVAWADKKLLTRYTTPERLAEFESTTEYRMHVSEDEYLLAFFTAGELQYICETPLPRSYKTFLRGEGFEEVDWTTSEKKLEDEKVAAAQAKLANELKSAVEKNDAQK